MMWTHCLIFSRIGNLIEFLDLMGQVIVIVIISFQGKDGLARIYESKFCQSLQRLHVCLFQVVIKAGKIKKCGDFCGPGIFLQ